MKTFIFLFMIGLFSITPALAQKKVAVVKLLRGEVEVLDQGKAKKLAAEQWVEEGSVVKTADKSFVKLIFIDKSQMNVGPNSEMKIEHFSGKDSGVLELVKGKIRSQVTKDYLQIEDKNKSKLFIKTSNAVMGVRGTDFMISSNGKTSAVVLFEGEVVLNKVDNARISNPAVLEQIVDRGVRIHPGEFSVVEPRREPTVPSLLNIQQRETLEKNDGFNVDRGPSNAPREEAAKSVVPAGLNGEVVSNNSDTLKNEVAQVVDKGGAVTPDAGISSNAAGFVDGDKVKPTNGSFLHVDSGTVIPPAPDAVFDENTNSYIAGTGNGSVGESGDYVPPKNMEITNNGEILVTVTGPGGKTNVIEIEKPKPVKSNEGQSLSDQANKNNSSGDSGGKPGNTPPKPAPPKNDILGGSGSQQMLPMQQLPGFNPQLINQVENKSSTTNTTIRVTPKD